MIRAHLNSAWRRRHATEGRFFPALPTRSVCLFALRLSVAVTALTLGLPAQAQAVQGEVEIDLAVESVAILEVIQAEGEMLIDDGSFSFMGLPSSEGSIDNVTVGNLAQMRLMTNFCLDFVVLEFPRRTGFRNTTAGTYLGAAIGNQTGRTLGVLPRAFWVNPADGMLHQPGFVHGGSDDELLVRGPDGTNEQFCNGIHVLGLGVETDWASTLQNEPEFIAPDTYVIPIMGTLVP